jgi:fumarate reductase (CoM/CoB) subunit B
MDEVKAKIFRYDPSQDREPRYEAYSIPWRDRTTLLEVLRYVYEHYEPIAFRYGCRSMLCGRCGVELNGKPVLACMTFVEPGDIEVEPLRGFPIIRDLVIDRTKAELRSFEGSPQLLRAKPPEEEPEKLPSQAVSRCMDLLKCRTCYLCQAACPMVEAAQDNTVGPAIMSRNIALRAYDPRDEGDRLTEAIDEGLWYCSNCANCKEVCPREIDIPAIVIEDLRAMAVERGLTNPAHKRFASSIKENHNPYREAHEDRLRWADGLNVSNEAETMFFVGCTSAYRRQEIAKSTVKILREADVEFGIPKDERCCGSPILRAGYRDLAKEMVEHGAQALKEAGAKRVICSCAGCYKTLKLEWPKLVGELPFEVIHMSQYLVDLVRNGKIALREVKGKVTYHDPCHLGRHCGVYDEPREVLKSIPGIEFVEMNPNRENSLCCGAGGGVEAALPDTAIKTAISALEKVRETRAKLLVSTYPFCKTNFLDAIAESGEKLEVCDLTELIVKSMRS